MTEMTSTENKKAQATKQGHAALYKSGGILLIVAGLFYVLVTLAALHTR